MKKNRVYQQVVSQIESDLDSYFAVKTIQRAYVPSFDFGMASAVVVIGQDGLVANVAKYVGDVPIIAVNPDPHRIDGILLPFSPHEIVSVTKNTIQDRNSIRRITLAEANLNNGQKLLAFNDFFIGASSHVSARYEIRTEQASEPQTSSGVLVCTGLVPRLDFVRIQYDRRASRNFITESLKNLLPLVGRNANSNGSFASHF